MTDEYKYDFFISHASEDKEDVARPLAEKLMERGFRVWYDEYELRIGDSLRRSIDRGIANSRYGVVILSPDFFAKDWPQRELDGLGTYEIQGRKVVLPVWHNVNEEYVRRYSPTLADRYAALTQKGLDEVVAEIVKVMRAAPNPGSIPPADVEEMELKRPTTVTQSRPYNTDISTEQARRSYEALLFSKMTAHELEDTAFKICSEGGAAYMIRILRKEVRALQKALVEGRSVATLVGEEASNRLCANPEEIFSEAMRNVLPVWVVLTDEGLDEIGVQVSNDLFRLYTTLPSVHNARDYDPLDLQKQIIYVAYAAGAYAIFRDRPDLARSFLGRTNPFDSYWHDRSWIRYVATMLARRDEIKKSIINPVKEYWSNNDYLVDSLGGEEETWDYLCQFDFLQCADIVASDNDIHDCFASFSVFRRSRVQPIIEALIDTYDKGIWIPILQESDLAQLIVALDEYATEWAGFEYDTWQIDRWSSIKIRTFLTRHGYKVR